MTGTKDLSGLAQALIVSTFLIASAPAHASIFFQNLFENPGAEDGAASPDGQTVVPVPGWMTSGNFTVVGYGTPGDFPTATDPGPSDRGDNFFAGGPDNASSTALQVIDVPGDDIGQIDAGWVGFEMYGYLGGFADEEDNAVLSVVYKDAQGAILSSTTIGPATAADRGNQTGLLSQFPVWGVVPPGTRRIELILTMTRVDGPYNNAFADNLFIWLIVADPVEPSTWGGIKASFK